MRWCWRWCWCLCWCDGDGDGDSDSDSDDGATADGGGDADADADADADYDVDSGPSVVVDAVVDVDVGASDKASDIRSHVGSSIAPDNELVLAMSTTAITTTVVVSMVKQLEDMQHVQGQLKDSILQLQMTQVQQGKVLQHLSGVIAEQQQQQEIAQLRQQQQQQRSLCWLDKGMQHQQ